MDALVVGPCCVPGRVAEKAGGLQKVGATTPVEGRLQGDVRPWKPAVPRSVGIDEVARSHEDLSVRVGGARRRYRAQRPRKIAVVGVEPGQKNPRGSSQSLVDGVALSAVWLAHPVAQVPLVLPDQRDAIVRAAAIDDDVLEVR